MKPLRPIGQRFIEFYPPIVGSTDIFGKFYTWEVTAHVLCARYHGDEKGRLREEIRCVNIVNETQEELDTRNSFSIQQSIERVEFNERRIKLHEENVEDV
jgi:hypothetical protein